MPRLLKVAFVGNLPRASDLLEARSFLVDKRICQHIISIFVFVLHVGEVE
jgi:hypothetical protein